MHFEWRSTRGKRYLWIVESHRTPKGVRRLWQLYVGTAESLHARLTGTRKVRLKTYPFGKAAALLRAAQETGLLDSLDRRIPRRDQEGLSVSQYLFLQIMGRAEKPLSREGMAAWFPSSALPLLWHQRAQPSSKTLLRYLQRLTSTGRQTTEGEAILTPATIHRIEEDILQAIRKEGLSLDRLLVDTTNFFTYHRDGGIHRKGHSKERRADKTLVGLGLVTSGPIPILSELFPGNEADPKVFHRVFEALVTRLERLDVPTDSLVAVFDRGINSTENFEDVLGAMHVIAAVNRQEARSLFALPLEDFHEVSRDGEGRAILGFPTRWHGYEQDWRALVVYREATGKHQQARWETSKKKVLDQVARWRASLEKGAPGRSEKALMRKMVELIPKDYHGVFDYGVERKGGKLWPRCAVPAEAEARLRRAFGKTVLITDLPEESVPDRLVVEGYVARAELEDDFKWLKDRGVMSVKPVWVWDEGEVRGHVFLCVMGLMLYRWLQWRVRPTGISLKRMVEELDGIRLGVVRTAEGKPELVVEEMNRRQAQLFSRLKLGDLIPQ
jgi:transposase